MSTKPKNHVLIQMAGAPGSGKTTLARGLARRYSAVVLDLDLVKAACLDSGVDWALAGPSAYEALYRLTEENIMFNNVIVDAPSHYDELPRRYRSIADRAGAIHVFVHCVCDDLDLIDQRLRNRQRHSSQMLALGKLPVGASLPVGPDGRPQGMHERATRKPAERVIVVDTAGDPSVRDMVSNVGAVVDALIS